MACCLQAQIAGGAALAVLLFKCGWLHPSAGGHWKSFGMHGQLGSQGSAQQSHVLMQCASPCWATAVWRIRGTGTRLHGQIQTYVLSHMLRMQVQNSRQVGRKRQGFGCKVNACTASATLMLPQSCSTRCCGCRCRNCTRWVSKARASGVKMVLGRKASSSCHHSHTACGVLDAGAADLRFIPGGLGGQGFRRHGA